MTLEAGAGAITDISGKITGNKLTAHARDAMDLDTTVATLEATNAVGAIRVTETDGITLENVQAGNGPITVTAGGAITVLDVESKNKRHPPDGEWDHVGGGGDDRRWEPGQCDVGSGSRCDHASVGHDQWK